MYQNSDVESDMNEFVFCNLKAHKSAILSIAKLKYFSDIILIISILRQSDIKIIALINDILACVEIGSKQI